MNWLFTNPPNVAVITTKRVMDKELPILHVSHDGDDGMWQFHDGNEVNEEEGSVISFREIIEIDPGIMELFDLPEGWIAFRNSIDDEWIRIERE